MHIYIYIYIYILGGNSSVTGAQSLQNLIDNKITHIIVVCSSGEKRYVKPLFPDRYIYVFMYVCLYVCIYVCMFVCMYV